MGYEDIFDDIKKRENEGSLLLLGKMLEDIDKLHPEEMLETLLKNVLAGKFFFFPVIPELSILDNERLTVFLGAFLKNKVICTIGDLLQYRKYLPLVNYLLKWRE